MQHITVIAHHSHKFEFANAWFRDAGWMLGDVKDGCTSDWTVANSALIQSGFFLSIQTDLWVRVKGVHFGYASSTVTRPPPSGPPGGGVHGQQKVLVAGWKKSVLGGKGCWLEKKVLVGWRPGSHIGGGYRIFEGRY